MTSSARPFFSWTHRRPAIPSPQGCGPVWPLFAPNGLTGSLRTAPEAPSRPVGRLKAAAAAGDGQVLDQLAGDAAAGQVLDQLGQVLDQLGQVLDQLGQVAAGCSRLLTAAHGWSSWACKCWRGRVLAACASNQVSDTTNAANRNTALVPVSPGIRLTIPSHPEERRRAAAIIRLPPAGLARSVRLAFLRTHFPPSHACTRPLRLGTTMGSGKGISTAATPWPH